LFNDSSCQQVARQMHDGIAQNAAGYTMRSFKFSGRFKVVATGIFCRDASIYRYTSSHRECIKRLDIRKHQRQRTDLPAHAYRHGLRRCGAKTKRNATLLPIIAALVY